MDKYSVKLMNQAVKDLDRIYTYIAKTLLEPGTALAQVDRIAAEISSLNEMPHRCSQRRHGTYAYKGYRQLFVDNYTVVFRINEPKRQVIVVTIRYSPSEF